MISKAFAICALIVTVITALEGASVARQAISPTPASYEVSP